MTGTEGDEHQSWWSSSSCLVLDHSSLSRWETSSWSEGPAHWVAPCNKSDIRDSNKRQFRKIWRYESGWQSNLQSWLSWEGASGVFHAIWLLSKPPGWKLHQLDLTDPQYLLSVSGLTRDRSCPETSWQSASGRRSRRRRERRTILTILRWGAEWFMLTVRPTSYTWRLFNNSTLYS